MPDDITIRDPLSRTGMRVDETGRALVSATVEHKGKPSSYVVNITEEEEDIESLTQTGVGGPMLYLQNRSNVKNLVIDIILINVDSAGGILKYVKNPVVEEVVNHNIQVPVGLDFTQDLHSVPALCYSWNEVEDSLMGISGGTTIDMSMAVAGTNKIKGPITLGTKDSIYIGYKGALQTEFMGSIRFHFEDK
jgi:hypothetical protein